MKWLLQGKRSGKTSALIRWADLKSTEQGDPRGRYIICLDRERAYQLVQQAEDMGCDVNFPLTLNEATKPYGSGVRELGVDDVDDILRAVLRNGHAMVKVVTATEEDAEADRDE
jgi:hypothetical protein